MKDTSGIKGSQKLRNIRNQRQAIGTDRRGHQAEHTDRRQLHQSPAGHNYPMTVGVGLYGRHDSNPISRHFLELPEIIFNPSQINLKPASSVKFLIHCISLLRLLIASVYAEGFVFTNINIFICIIYFYKYYSDHMPVCG